MPELPEVETTLRGLSPHVENRRLLRLDIRQPRLRWPVPASLAQLHDVPVLRLQRRAKYLLLTVPSGDIVIHLGMSGTLRVVPDTTPLRTHDHVDLCLDNGQVIRFNDPRRFGCVLFQSNGELLSQLAGMGPEPLTDAFSGDWLYQRSRGRSVAVKNFIMTNAVVVGVGNIYAQESLFLAGVHPSRAAGNISRQRYQRLAQTIKTVLGSAIEAGGTTLRDFSNASGKPGYFAQQLHVYGRAGQPCLSCGTTLKATRHGQRSTSYCSRCQR